MLTQAKRHVLSLVALALALGAFQLAGAAAALGAAAPQLGEPTLMLNAKSAFDPYVTEAAPRTQEFAQQRYWRMRAYPPFFDRALHWAAPTQFYKDLYAIYNPRQTELIEENPDWVLRDAGGEPLYIPWGCSEANCPQYAADIGSPEWRRHWIEEAATELDKGYVGIFIDDVNMEMRVSDRSGEPVRPIDPRTGAPMTDEDWRRYIAEFTEEIRAAFPDAEITHNAHWWVDHADPFVRRQIVAADTIELERGFSDDGLTAGRGTYGFLTFIEHVEWLHAQGKTAIYEPHEIADERAREFELAGYFLLQQGSDALAVDEDGEAYPDRWWHGWDTDLGRPRGGLRIRDGVLQRRFSRGLVLLNQPDSPSRRIELARPYLRLSGRRADSVRLGPGRGLVLSRAGIGKR
jgi:hypothetical protein